MSKARAGDIYAGGIVLRFHSRLRRIVAYFFFRLGFWIAVHPKITLLISAIFTAICCLGFRNFTVVTDGKDLWVPDNSLSKEHGAIVFSTFKDESDFAVLLFEASSEGNANLLTKDALDRVWEIHGEVLDLKTALGTSYEGLCELEAGENTCRQPLHGVTRFWRGNHSEYKATVANDTDVLDAVNVATFPDGREVQQDLVFGNSATFDEGGRIIAARAMSQIYDIDPHARGKHRQEVLSWQGIFQDFMSEEVESYRDTFTVVFLTGRSITDALEESVSGEIFLVAITYGIMMIFVICVIGRFTSGPVRRRSWLALGGVILVMASAVASYGINSGLGIPFTSLAQLLPFILVGIGVDDMFVIVASFDHTDPDLEVKNRVAQAMERCGLSIAYTSLTNGTAFLLGSLTTLPAVRYFCLYAGTAVLVDFVMQVTTFVALLAMDANRQQMNKLDTCCCFTSTQPQHKVYVERTMVHSMIAPASETSRELRFPELRGIGRFMRDTYAPFILSKSGKIVVLMLTTGFLSAGIYGATQVRQGFDVWDLAPDDHYARTYNEVARKYQLEADSQYIPLRVYTGPVDYTDVDVQVQIQATDNLMMEQRFVSGPLESWLASFVAWAHNGTEFRAFVNVSDGYMVYTDKDSFYGALKAFVNDGNHAVFKGDLKYSGEAILISRTQTYLVDQTSTKNNILAMTDARDVMKASSLDPKPFAFSTLFIFTEQFLVIYQELISNFFLALAAVAILSTLVLGRLLIVILVCLTVVMIDVELLGFVHHWGLEINAITVIELIMAIGLVVDYVIHIVHFALHQDNIFAEKETRLADALGEIGPSVMLGAFTTFIGILPMVFASTTLFRIFFKLFFIVIVLGFFHGIAFVPVALSIIDFRPLALEDARDKDLRQKNQAEETNSDSSR